MGIDLSTRPLAASAAALALFCTVSTGSRGAARLMGVVLKNEIGGEPLADVAVSSPDAGAPVVTDASGCFELAFPDLAPGDLTDLDVQLKGWVVLNDFELKLTLCNDDCAQPVMILLAKAEEKEHWALQYYRHKGKEPVMARYRHELAELERKGLATARECDVLTQERDAALVQVDRLARELVAMKPSDGDALYRQAIQLLLSNRLGEALALLDEQKLQESAGQARRLEEVARRVKAETARKYRLRGKLLALGFQPDKAAEAYLAATQVFPDDFEI